MLVGKNKREHKINQDNHILYSKLLKAFSLIVYRRVFSLLVSLLRMFSSSTTSQEIGTVQKQLG